MNQTVTAMASAGTMMEEETDTGSVMMTESVETTTEVFLQRGSKPMGETSVSLAAIIDNEKNKNVQ